MRAGLVGTVVDDNAITLRSSQVDRGVGWGEAAEIDARRGTIGLSAATATGGGTLQTGTFGGAIFRLTQARRGSEKGLTTLALIEGVFRGAPSYAGCKARADGDAPEAQAASSRALQLLHATAHGQFRTRGRYAAATVRGTQWSISDRCGGTLIVVQRDTVVVQDFVRHVTILLRAHHSYLAKAPPARPRVSRRAARAGRRFV